MINFESKVTGWHRFNSMASTHFAGNFNNTCTYCSNREFHSEKNPISATNNGNSQKTSMRKKRMVINGTDTNVWPACADKVDLPHSKLTYEFDWLSQPTKELFTTRRRIWIYNWTISSSCTLILWKFFKDPIVGRLIISGRTWILTPAFVFVGHRKNSARSLIKYSHTHNAC